MTRIVVRLLASLVCVPMVIIGCVAFVIFVDETNIMDDDRAVVVAATAGPWALAGAWLVVWLRVIRWTPKRRVRTLQVLGFTVGAAGAVALLARAAFSRQRDWEGWTALGNLLVGLGGLMACLWVWTETARERIERIRESRAGGQAGRLCPACGYDMGGLTNLVCPECGTGFTLSDLMDERRRREEPEDFTSTRG